jgi:hypothetical protein
MGDSARGRTETMYNEHTLAKEESTAAHMHCIRLMQGGRIIRGEEALSPIDGDFSLDMIPQLISI